MNKRKAESVALAYKKAVAQMTEGGDGVRPRPRPSIIKGYFENLDEALDEKDAMDMPERIKYIIDEVYCASYMLDGSLGPEALLATSQKMDNKDAKTILTVYRTYWVRLQEHFRLCVAVVAGPDPKHAKDIYEDSQTPSDLATQMLYNFPEHFLVRYGMVPPDVVLPTELPTIVALHKLRMDMLANPEQTYKDIAFEWDSHHGIDVKFDAPSLLPEDRAAEIASMYQAAEAWGAKMAAEKDSLYQQLMQARAQEREAARLARAKSENLASLQVFAAATEQERRAALQSAQEKDISLAKAAQEVAAAKAREQDAIVSAIGSQQNMASVQAIAKDVMAERDQAIAAAKAASDQAEAQAARASQLEQQRQHDAAVIAQKDAAVQAATAAAIDASASVAKVDAQRQQLLVQGTNLLNSAAEEQSRLQAELDSARVAANGAQERLAALETESAQKAAQLEVMKSGIDAVQQEAQAEISKRDTMIANLQQQIATMSQAPAPISVPAAAPAPVPVVTFPDLTDTVKQKDAEIAALKAQLEAKVAVTTPPAMAPAATTVTPVLQTQAAPASKSVPELVKLTTADIKEGSFVTQRHIDDGWARHRIEKPLAQAKADAWWAKHPRAEAADKAVKAKTVVKTAAAYIPGKNDFLGVDTAKSSGKSRQYPTSVKAHRVHF